VATKFLKASDVMIPRANGDVTPTREIMAMRTDMSLPATAFSQLAVFHDDLAASQRMDQILARHLRYSMVTCDPFRIINAIEVVQAIMTGKVKHLIVLNTPFKG
jgi:hypothetical protein